MVQELVNYYWAHPVAVTAAIIGVILILIWMSGSGSRQRFVTLKRSKETEQMARDISRIASSLERIAKSYEMPSDFVGRPIPPGFDDTIAQNHVHAEDPAHAEVVETSGVSRAAEDRPANPPGGPASSLGETKKLNIPNPLYRPK